MALTTLYFQRRDQHRVALLEVKIPAVATAHNHKNAETIELKTQAETEISPVRALSCFWELPREIG
jgi:hypothetical protein